MIDDINHVNPLKRFTRVLFGIDPDTRPMTMMEGFFHQWAKVLRIDFAERMSFATLILVMLWKPMTIFTSLICLAGILVVFGWSRFRSWVEFATTRFQDGVVEAEVRDNLEAKRPIRFQELRTEKGGS